jgi:hypothetical protein
MARQANQTLSGVDPDRRRSPRRTLVERRVRVWVVNGIRVRAGFQKQSDAKLTDRRSLRKIVAGSNSAACINK